MSISNCSSSKITVISFFQTGKTVAHASPIKLYLVVLSSVISLPHPQQETLWVLAAMFNRMQPHQISFCQNETGQRMSPDPWFYSKGGCARLSVIWPKAYSVLFLIKRSFSATVSISVRKQLFLSLVLPIVTNGSPVWRPSRVKDFVNLEKLQKRATKFIIGNAKMDYKSHLTHLQLLPLMYRLELYDIMFFVNSLTNLDISTSWIMSLSRTRTLFHPRLISWSIIPQ